MLRRFKMSLGSRRLTLILTPNFEDLTVTFVALNGMRTLKLPVGVKTLTDFEGIDGQGLL
jgi:hypothetical protein